MEDIRVLVTPNSGRFLDELRSDLRARGYAYSTEKTYLHVVKRFIIYNKYRHPQTMGKADIEDFLNHLVVNAEVSPGTQRLPTVLTHCEVEEVLRSMKGTPN